MGGMHSAMLLADDDTTKGVFSYRLLWSPVPWLGIGDRALGVCATVCSNWSVFGGELDVVALSLFMW